MPGETPIGPGTRIDDVVVEREIGSGAFGVVYLGRDTVIGRPVAMKVLRGAQHDLRPEDRERFLAEARLIGSLQSPNIVTIHHVHWLQGGGCAIEMEYVDGGSLEDLVVGDMRLPVETAVRLSRGILGALVRAH